MTRHHVGITLDDDDLSLLGDIALGEIQTIENTGLVIHRSLRGVQVFRALIVLTELSCAKTDGLPRHISNRPHQSPSETVVDASVSLGDQPRIQELLDGETHCNEVFGERVVGRGRIAHPKTLRRESIEAALPQKSPPQF